ncbi:MAG: LamG-like jellyroll fold domain-containing protein [Prolixibacteraceae bacterium]
MKILKYFLAFTAALIVAAGCNEGIDPISPFDPGPDKDAPVITIKSPTQGQAIEVDSLVVSIFVQLEVTDDIELKSILVFLDNTEIGSMTTFKDYRRALMEFYHKNVGTGVHILTVKATDLGGKTSEKSVTFEKKPPYVPVYPGEVFYMPFNGDFTEKISFKEATKVGNPGFTDASLKGTKAYAGATDSYLTFPMTGLKSSEFSASFWYKVNPSPDRSGILNASPAGEDRTKGFRLFREGGATSQRIKANVGWGGGETWNDGALIPAPGTNWVHIALSVSPDKCVLYINGLGVEVPNKGAIDWTGVDVLGIASGAPNFTYWNHNFDRSQYDELRLFNRALTDADVQAIIQNDKPYVPKNGEIFYMPFEGTYKDLIGNKEATKVGSPAFAAGKIGKAYAGAADSYLTFPAAGLTKTSSLSAAFWMKINATPDRAGILVMGPPDEAAPAAPNNRKSGFRFFREGSATAQIFKLNTGNGTADSWFDGGTAATIDPTPEAWVHFAYTISPTECVVYINGEVVKQGTITGISWEGCDILSIMSGAPRFTGWNHFSDLSLMDELHIFNKALTQAEVKEIMNAEK